MSFPAYLPIGHIFAELRWGDPRCSCKLAVLTEPVVRRAILGSHGRGYSDYMTKAASAHLPRMFLLKVFISLYSRKPIFASCSLMATNKFACHICACIINY